MATVNKDEAKASPKVGKGEIRRAYLTCEALKAEGGQVCGFQTKRVAERDMRSAEIEIGKHQLADHSRAVWVAIAMERKERELK